MTVHHLLKEMYMMLFTGPTIITVTTRNSDVVLTDANTATPETNQSQATALKTPEISNNKQSKRHLTVSGTAS
jgi:hypothetical protein